MDLLISYAMQHVGVLYRWGGDDPTGWDCSGLVQEILASVGIDPPGDQTAQSLCFHFRRTGQILSSPQAGALAFYGNNGLITHVGFCLDTLRMLEAGGGGSKTKTVADAVFQNAYVRVRPVRSRRDLVTIVMPPYQTVGISA